MPATLEAQELKTFSAFEGKVSGNSIKGVSIIQEGPALGHGVWVDSTTLSQVKKLAAAAGRVKAKINHWSGIQDTVGYFENFRIRAGKLLGDVTLFDAHPGAPVLLQMIDEIPASFGVSIMFAGAAPELDKETGNYMTRVADLYSADFVDTPAANRDGVFSEGIDSGDEGMANEKPNTTPEQKPAVTVEQFDALTAKFDALLAKFEAKEKAPEVTLPAPDAKADDIVTKVTAAFDAKMDALAKLFAAAPPQTPVVPPQDKDDDALENTKTRKEFEALSHPDRNAFIAKGGKVKDAA